MAQTSWPDLATAVVAIYGAILATYSLLKDRRERRRVLKVRLWTAIPVSANGAGDPLLMIGAANPGERVVHVVGAGFKVVRPKQSFALFQPQSDVRFPHALEEGKSCSVWLESRNVATQLRGLGYAGTVRLVGYFQDAVGTQHFSKALRFDIEAWSKARTAS
jgi:hypothetical protein